MGQTGRRSKALAKRRECRAECTHVLIADGMLLPRLAPTVVATMGEVKRRKLVGYVVKTASRFGVAVVMALAVWPFYGFGTGLRIATGNRCADGFAAAGVRAWFGSRYCLLAVMTWELSYLRRCRRRRHDEPEDERRCERFWSDFRDVVSRCARRSQGVEPGTDLAR